MNASMREVQRWCRVCAILAALVLAAGAAEASILQVWLTADTVTAAGVDFNVYIWARVVADPAIPGENLTDMGIADMAVTVYSMGTTGVLAPVPLQVPALERWVKGTFNINAFDSGMNIRAARQDWTSEPGGADGDLDAVMLAAATSGADLNVGVGSDVLVATQVWRLSTFTRAYLGCYVEPTSRHWNINLPSPYKETFSGVQTGNPPVHYHYSLTGPTRVATGYTGTWTVSGDNPGSVTATMHWGDTTDSTRSGTLPLNFNHAYYQPATYGLYASVTDVNGTGQTNSLNVSVVDDPHNMLVTVNGVPIADGGAATVFGHNLVTIVATADGAIDIWLIKCGDMVLSTTNTWTGDSYDLYGGEVTVTAANTALGSAADTTEFMVVPEPATLSLLLLGAAAMLRRRR